MACWVSYPYEDIVDCWLILDEMLYGPAVPDTLFSGTLLDNADPALVYCESWPCVDVDVGSF